MKESRSAVYSLITGLAGGALAWCGVEWMLLVSAGFPDLRIFSILLGTTAGFLLGAVAPTAEGLRQAQKHKILSSILVGALLGGIAGAGGMLLGQLLMTLIADALVNVSLGFWGSALSRIPGWILMGMAVGAASGVRSRSLRRIGAGLLGGFAGGFLGGLIAELSGSFLGGLPGRASGIILWGMLVALIADRAEARRSRGRLTVLSGPLKGRSFPVNQKKMTIATDRPADLTIPGEANNKASSGNAGLTEIRIESGTVVVEAADGDAVQVNGQKTEKTELRYDDVIKVGGTTVIYEARR